MLRAGISDSAHEAVRAGRTLVHDDVPPEREAQLAQVRRDGAQEAAQLVPRVKVLERERERVQRADVRARLQRGQHAAQQVVRAARADRERAHGRRGRVAGRCG